MRYEIASTIVIWHFGLLGADKYTSSYISAQLSLAQSHMHRHFSTDACVACLAIVTHIDLSSQKVS